MAGSSRKFLDDTTLESMGETTETSEASEDNLDALFKALLHDWETMTPAPVAPAIGEPHPSFAHTLRTLQVLECLKAKNTATSTGTWVKRFSKWRMERQIGQKLEEIQKEQLDGILQLFLQKFTKMLERTMNSYEPDSLRSMMATLDWHLREKGSILKDQEFDASCKVLNGKAIELQEQGSGKEKAQG